MNYIYVKISDTRILILNYNFVCGLVFIPLTAYASIKLRKFRISRILKVAGYSSMSAIILLKILQIRAGGDVIVVPGIDDCIMVKNPSYLDNERMIRYVNDKFRHLAIKGIIYITKEALCYLVATEGLVDFPFAFLERIKIDGVYSFVKTASEWAVWSIGIALALAGIVPLQHAIVFSGVAWLHINSIKILEPSVQEVDKLTGKFVPRIGTRKDAIVFDAKQGPLPPEIEKSVKPVRINRLETEYEITETNLVDVSKVSGLKNKFSDRRFKRPTSRLKKPGKTVYFSDMIKKWQKDQNTAGEATSRIDKMLE